MNTRFAKEVGYLKYIYRRILWRIVPPKKVRLHTGVDFATPRNKFFASDVFVTQGNVDWNSEYILSAFLKSQKEKGDFIDVGSHIGYYSCLVSPYVSTIYAFEPDERNHDYLNNALKDIPNSNIVESAVADHDGDLLFDAGGESSISHIHSGNVENGKKPELVKSITIDSFVLKNNVNTIAIKIDIEGYEILALKGARCTLISQRPVILMEFSTEGEKPNHWGFLEQFINEIKYVPFAVTRVSDNFFKYKYSFKKQNMEELRDADFKMIFLVPEKHLKWFEDFSADYPNWNKALLHGEKAQEPFFFS